MTSAMRAAILPSEEFPCISLVARRPAAVVGGSLLTFEAEIGILRYNAKLMAGALPPNDWLSLVTAPTVFIFALAIFSASAQTSYQPAH